jgi:hypothetical protein
MKEMKKKNDRRKRKTLFARVFGGLTLIFISYCGLSQSSEDVLSESPSLSDQDKKLTTQANQLLSSLHLHCYVSHDDHQSCMQFIQQMITNCSENEKVLVLEFLSGLQRHVEYYNYRFVKHMVRKLSPTLSKIVAPGSNYTEQRKAAIQSGCKTHGQALEDLDGPLSIIFKFDEPFLWPLFLRTFFYELLEKKSRWTEDLILELESYLPQLRFEKGSKNLTLLTNLIDSERLTLAKVHLPSYRSILRRLLQGVEIVENEVYCLLKSKSINPIELGRVFDAWNPNFLHRQRFLTAIVINGGDYDSDVVEMLNHFRLQLDSKMALQLFTPELHDRPISKKLIKYLNNYPYDTNKSNERTKEEKESLEARLASIKRWREEEFFNNPLQKKKERRRLMSKLFLEATDKYVAAQARGLAC